jgi:hypothetical protein
MMHVNPKTYFNFIIMSVRFSYTRKTGLDSPASIVDRNAISIQVSKRFESELEESKSASSGPPSNG